MEVFAVLCGRGSAAHWKSPQIPVISSAHLATPRATPIATRGEGSFSYQGVSTRGLSGKKNQHKHKLWISRGHPDPYARMPRGQKVSPHHRGRRKTHFFRGAEKAHKLFQHKLFGPHPKPPILCPQKKFMCLISWERTQKRDPHKFFRGDFWGRKRGPKRVIFGHKKFSLLFFSCPYFWCGRPRFSARTSMTRRVVEKLCTKKFALIFWPLG